MLHLAKLLCWILRHKALEYRLRILEHFWVRVGDLTRIYLSEKSDRLYSAEEIVTAATKQSGGRLEVLHHAGVESTWFIRACDGHSFSQNKKKSKRTGSNLPLLGQSAPSGGIYTQIIEDDA